MLPINPEQLVNYPNLTKEQMIDLLWNYINNSILEIKKKSGFDENGIIRLLAWKSDSTCPSWRMSRIQELLNWGDGIWEIYYMLKAKIENGETISCPNIPPCPYTFTDLLFEIPPI